MFNNLFNWNKNEDQTRNTLPKDQKRATENLSSEFAQAKEVEASAVKLPAVSLEEQLAKIEAAKEKIAELQNGRQERYLHAKQLEEQLIMKGLTEVKVREIKDQIMSEGREISGLINGLREEYGLEPKPVEIYEARLDMIMKEIDRVKENMAPEYREVKKSITSYFGDSNLSEIAQRNIGALNNFRKYVLEQGSLPEVQNFYSEVKDLRFYEELDLKLFTEKFKDFVKTIDKAIVEKTMYKTQGEMNEVQARLDKLVMLSDSIYKELKDAKNKEGRFDLNKDKYF